jgi:three-Cys-motif partner protein
MSDNFFNETTDQSQVKAEIVEKYFYAWAKIIIGSQKRYRAGREHRIGYVDLFAGPGRYKDGATSTPLRIIQKAIEDDDFSERLVTIFNDKDEEFVRKLDKAIKDLPGIERLRYEPTIWNAEVGDEIANAFRQIHTIPLLAFVDPWGYKGLSLKLVNAFLENWGCDCIFFFNYNRINMGLSNPFVHEHMCALFGEERAANLRDELEGMDSDRREATIVNELGLALQEYGHRFVLPFCFKNAEGTRTSHHLILVSKHFKAYDVMKEIMAKSSSEEHQGVPSFTYSPAVDDAQLLLFDLNRPLDDLREMLLTSCAGKTITLPKLYEEHSVGLPYLKRNYTAALVELEEEGLIEVERPPRGRKKAYGPKTTISFPGLG